MNPVEHLFQSMQFELPHDKTNKMTCAPSEDSNQPDQSLLCVQWVAKDLLIAKSLIRLSGCAPMDLIPGPVVGTFVCRKVQFLPSCGSLV